MLNCELHKRKISYQPAKPDSHQHIQTSASVFRLIIHKYAQEDKGQTVVFLLTHLASACSFPTLSSLFYSVEDKQRVATLTHIPKFLPEITIGAHEYDEKYYAYKSVGRAERFTLTVLVWSPVTPPLSPN